MVGIGTLVEFWYVAFAKASSSMATKTMTSQVKFSPTCPKVDSDKVNRPYTI
jgi:hypothetical protein